MFVVATDEDVVYGYPSCDESVDMVIVSHVSDSCSRAYHNTSAAQHNPFVLG
jgi:hypothetical protein